MNRDSVEARLQQRNQLATDRQQLSDALSKLQNNLRNSARTMAPNQPETAQKLRQALTEMDERDLDNHMQRTADWLRRGINPNSNGTESEIAQGLQKLSQQLREAQKDLRPGQPGQHPGFSSGDQTAALDQVRRLRQQLEEMADSNGRNAPSPSGQNAQNRPGDRGKQQPGGRGQGQNQSPSDLRTQDGQLQRGGGSEQQTDTARRGNNGEVRNGGGYGDGAAWGNINTGNNTYAGRPAGHLPTDASGNPQDTEQAYRRQLREFTQLNQMVMNDPALTREIKDLTRRMQELDPKRFPGNPALVEQMHREVLSSIDRIEMELMNHRPTVEARSGKPASIPIGYEESVADYYRRLSKNEPK
jgi:hypothetical protein